VRKLLVQLYEEVAINLFGVELLDKVARRFHRATGGQKVVVEQYHVVFIDGILVDLDGIDAIFLGVALLNGFAWQFAGLATQHDACAHAIGEGRAHDKAATLNTYDLGDAFVFIQVVHLVTQNANTFRCLE
jgi:2-keto-3-deoxy-L-rhamnonate aldolase RhmA